MTYQVAGSIRFNTDSSKLEIYNGEQWWSIDATSPEQQTGGTRGVWGGGEAPGVTDVIQFVNIDTNGDTVDFGNLLANTTELTSAASRTRGLFFRGGPGGDSNTIQFVTIASKGNAPDFGDIP